MGRAKSKPRLPRLLVFKEFAYGAGKEWTWKFDVPRRFVVRSVNTYTTAAGANRAGRQVARELGIKLK